MSAESNGASAPATEEKPRTTAEADITKYKVGVFVRCFALYWGGEILGRRDVDG